MKKPKFLSFEENRHGTQVVYFRRNGKRTRIYEPYGSPAFFDRYAELLNGLDVQEPDRKIKPMTLAWLISQFYLSPTFQSYAKSTQATRRRIYTAMEATGAGEKRITEITPLKIKEGRDRRILEKGPAAAKHFVQALNALFTFAVDREIVETNPCDRVAAPRPENKPHTAWTLDLIQQYRAHHKLGTAARLLFDILEITGCRISDARTMGWQQHEGGWLEIIQQKTAHPVLKELDQELRRSVEAFNSGQIVWLTKQNGQPYSEKSLGMRFRTWAKEAGIPQGYTAHGLRHSLGNRMAEAGASELEIMHALGHKSPNQARIYTSQANRKVMAKRSARILKMSHPSAKVRHSKA